MAVRIIRWMLNFYVGQLIESVRNVACVVPVFLHFGSFSIYEARDQSCPDQSVYLSRFF